MILRCLMGLLIFGLGHGVIAAVVDGAAAAADVQGMPFPNPFFAMDTGTRDAAHKGYAEQAGMLRELGYDGSDHTGTRDLAALLKELDARGLRLFAIYVGACIDDEALPAGLEKAIGQLRGRPTKIWLPLSSRRHESSSPAGDAAAVRLLRRIADLAEPAGLEVALYPHTGMWLERVEDAVRVARKTGRANVGATFNLCHWLRVSSGRDLPSVLVAAMPYLKMVTVNGAEPDGTNWKTLIQPLDRGAFAVYDLLVALHELGYDGPIGLQGYGIGGDAAANLRRSMTAWRGFQRRFRSEWKALLSPGLAAWGNPHGAWELVGEVGLAAGNRKQLAWQPGDQTLVNGVAGHTRNLLTAGIYGDHEAHVEFMVPEGSNSGVYFQGRYEVQILDSWGVEAPTQGDCGGIYQRWDPTRQPHGYDGHPPARNASRPPGEWQEFDVIFRAPQFDEEHRKTTNGVFVRVAHDGVVVHRRVAVAGPTRAAAFGDEQPEGPLMLQGDHGPVAFRRILVRPLRTPGTAGAVGVPTAAELAMLAEYRAGDSRAFFSRLDAHFRALAPGASEAPEREVLKLLSSSKVSVDAKRELCRLLERWGSCQSVAELAALLGDADLGHQALCALQARPCDAADEAVLAALKRQPGPLLTGLVAAAGQRRLPAAVPLLRALVESESPATAVALEALGRIATPEALDALLDLKVPAELRLVRYDAALAAADRLLAAGNATAAGRCYRQVLTAVDAGTARVGALRGMVKAKSPQAAAEVLKALRSGEVQYQQAAAALVRQVPGAELTASLCAELPRLDAAARVPLLAALGARGDKRAADAAARELGSESEPVKVAAAQALRQLGGPAQVPLLCQALGGEPELAETAQATLERLPGTATDAALVEQLATAPPAIQAALIRVLAARHATQAVPRLLALPAATDAGVRRAAARALAELAGGEDLPDMLKILFRLEDAAARQRFSQALLAVAGRMGDAEQRTRTLIAAIPQAEEPACEQLLYLLGYFGGETALDQIRRRLAAPAAVPRLWALRALLVWPDPTPLALAQGVLTKAQNEVERGLALRAILRFLPMPGAGEPAALRRAYQAALAAALTTTERRLVLYGAGAVPDPTVLDLIRPLMSEADLATEVQNAYLLSAKRLADGFPAAVRKRLAAPRWADAPAMFQEQVRALYEAIGHVPANQLTAWMLAGPYRAAAARLFDTAFEPEPPSNGGAWRFASAFDGPFTKFILPGDVNLGARIGGENQVAYLRCTVCAAAPHDAVLELGSDDGIKVWLNGNLIHANDARRAVGAGDDRVPCHLTAGSNRLLLKVTQLKGEWGASVRLESPAGSVIPGLRVIPE